MVRRKKYLKLNSIQPFPNSALYVRDDIKMTGAQGNTIAEEMRLVLCYLTQKECEWKLRETADSLSLINVKAFCLLIVTRTRHLTNRSFSWKQSLDV